MVLLLGALAEHLVVLLVLLLQRLFAVWDVGLRSEGQGPHGGVRQEELQVMRLEASPFASALITV